MLEYKTITERLTEYDEIRLRSAKLYGTFGIVNCPALGKDIRFTSLGFNHLVYQSPKKMRDKRAQILRFDMLEKAKRIVQISTTYQEYEEENISKKVNKYGSWIQANVFVRRWGLIAIIDGYRLKVVLTQEGNGAIDFLSVVPAWITSSYRDIKIIHLSVKDGLANTSDEEVLKNAKE